MQCSAGRPTSSASTSVRPPSSRTRWNSCGPSPVAHPGPQRRVRVHPLRGRGPRQQLQEDLEIPPRREDLLDAHDRHEDLRAASAHMRPLPSDSTTPTSPVSAIAKFAPDTATGTVRNFARRCSRAASAIADRLVAQRLALSDRALEQRADLGAVAMDRRHQDVRLLVARRELDDQLREVGLQRMDALGRERLVHADLVRGQRLDLDHLVGACARAIRATIAFASAPSRAQCTMPPARA